MCYHGDAPRCYHGDAPRESDTRAQRRDGSPWKKARCKHTVPPLKGYIDDEGIHRRRKKLSVLQNPVPRESCVAPVLGHVFLNPSSHRSSIPSPRHHPRLQSQPSSREALPASRGVFLSTSLWLESCICIALRPSLFLSKSLPSSRRVFLSTS